MTAPMTEVVLVFYEGRIEHWLRFGTQDRERILDRRRRVLLPGPDPPRHGSPLAIVIEPNRFWRFRVAAAERFLALAVRPRLPIRPRTSTLVPLEEVARKTYMLWAIATSNRRLPASTRSAPSSSGPQSPELSGRIMPTAANCAACSGPAAALFRVAIASFFKHAACVDGQVSPWSVSANPSSTIPSPLDRADLDRQRESRAFAASRERWSTSMPDPLAGLPPRYLRTPEAARWLGISGRTLEKHRIYGTGPIYRKIGGRVVYRVDDLERWVDKGRRTSTSDPGTDTVLPPKRTAG